MTTSVRATEFRAREPRAIEPGTLDGEQRRSRRRAGRATGGLWLALALLTAVAERAAAEAPYDGSYFKRVTLVVADIDRSLTIYRDILGFDLDGVQESSADSYSYPVFQIPASAKLRFATLSAGSEQVRTLALTEVKGIELPAAPRPFRTASVIRSRDIEADFARLEALGLETTKPKFVDGTEFDFWERAFVDFDGHLIVLYEIVLPAAEEGE